MIENRMGMGIDQRDEEGGAAEDEAAAPVVNALNSCGATGKMCNPLFLYYSVTLSHTM
jgi:hypothetical protein